MGAKVTGLSELIVALQNAEVSVIDATKKVVGKGSLNVKRDAKRIVREASHRGYLPHYPRSIGYDVSASGTVVTGQIGPDRAKLQGGLGRIIEFGTVNSAPIPHLSPALGAEEPRLAQVMEQLGAALLEGQPAPDAAGPVQDPGDS